MRWSKVLSGAPASVRQGPAVRPAEAPGAVVLSGEPPTRRMSAAATPRRQILAGGEPERAGVADACRHRDLEILTGGDTAQVAYHWA
ncbi:hypothetical protein LV779_06015 [Streptomyces thinghirensis]|nr:hypothetical protein [Streptomyces thinghirensis]